MTNRVSRVGNVCVREGHPESAALGIDRCREWQVLLRLRGLGIGPRLIRMDRVRDVTLFEWLPGSQPNEVGDAVKLLARLHAQPRCGLRFSPAAMIRQYLRLIEVPGKLRDLSSACADVSEGLEESAELTLCHNDCVAKNWIQLPDGGLRLIDFEFAGDNDPAFDLATLSLEWDAYPPSNPRVRAYRPVVDCLWTLYCLVVAEVDPECRAEVMAQAAFRMARLGV